jgi:hypothetical protein
MSRRGILNTDVLNRTSNILLEQGDKANALETMLRSLQMAPNQEILKPMIEVIRSKRPKVAFFCGLTATLNSFRIFTYIEQRFQVRFVESRD